MSSNEEPEIRRLALDDAEALRRFYNGLSVRSKRLFHPLGDEAAEERCKEIVENNRPGASPNCDLVAVAGDLIVGWCFLWVRDGKPGEASFGLGVADDMQGIGLGNKLMAAVLAAARPQGFKLICLSVVQDNVIAQHLYEKHGFVRSGSYVGRDGLDYFSMQKEE